MNGMLALVCCSLILLAGATVSAEVDAGESYFRHFSKMSAERQWTREYMQACLDAKKRASTGFHDDANECFDRVQRKVDEGSSWPMCRTLVGRLSSFEVCVDGGQVLVP